MTGRLMVLFLSTLAVPVWGGVVAKYGDWQVETTTDTMWNQISAHATTRAASGDEILQVTCDSGRYGPPHVAIRWQRFLKSQSSDRTTLRYSIDGGSPMTVATSMTPDGKMTWVESTDFTDWLLPAYRLVVEVVDYRGATYQATFSLRGLTKATNHIKRLCASQQ